VPCPKELKYMKLFLLSSLLFFTGCTTIHFRSNNTIPVTFEGNPKHQKAVEVTGTRDFYFWGLEPEHHEVFIDKELKKAGVNSLSKAIIYEQKDPQDMLISFLTFGLYLPRSWTIMGFTEGKKELEDVDLDTISLD